MAVTEKGLIFLKIFYLTFFTKYAIVIANNQINFIINAKYTIK